MTMQVGFYFERYRFYTENKFDDPGTQRGRTLPTKTDNVTDNTTSRNKEAFPLPKTSVFENLSGNVTDSILGGLS